MTGAERAPSQLHWSSGVFTSRITRAHASALAFIPREDVYVPGCSEGTSMSSENSTHAYPVTRPPASSDTR